MSARELAEQAELRLLTAEHSINQFVGQKRIAEAKTALTDAQGDLRDLQRTLAAEERELRACITDERLSKNRAGHVMETFAGAKAHAIARARSVRKRSTADDMAAALRPYGVAKAYIDRALANLDQIKAQITQASTDEPSTNGR